MINSPDGSCFLDHFPWKHGDTGTPGIWRLSAPFNGPPEVVPFPTGGNGGLLQGDNGWFGIWRKNDAADGFELHACKFSEPSRSQARCWWSTGGVGEEGDQSAWLHLPRFYLANDPKFPLAFALTVEGQLRPLQFDWYNDETYDRGYEYLACLVSDPTSGDLIIGMHRSGDINVCHPETGGLKKRLSLADASHSSKLIVGAERNVLWAMGYDTIFRLTLPQLEVEASRLVQPPIYNRDFKRQTRHFAGGMFLQPERRRICVARPYSGDVIGFDTDTLLPVAEAKLNGEPLDLAVVGDELIARAWKTGDLLRGRLARVSSSSAE